MSQNESRTAVMRGGAVLLGGLGSFALFAAYMVIPPAGLLSGLLAPFPAVFSRFRFGRGTAVSITAGAAALLAVLFGYQVGALYLAQCGMVALVMPELLSRGLGAARSIAWTTAANLLLYAVAAAAIALAGGQNVHQLAVKEISGSISQAVAMYEKAGIKGDELEQVKQSLAVAGQLIQRTYPAFVTILLMAMGGANLALLRRSASRWNLEVRTGDFKDFRTPHPLVWVLIAAGFAMVTGLGPVTTPALNVLVVLSTVYFLQGLAVISTVVARQPFSGVMRIALFLMLLFQPYLAALVALVGLFDLWGDFRTPKNQENL